MIVSRTHGQPIGTVTDDTETVLCIARSPAEHGEFNPADDADRFVGWKTSSPFDIGS